MTEEADLTTTHYNELINMFTCQFRKREHHMFSQKLIFHLSISDRY